MLSIFTNKALENVRRILARSEGGIHKRIDESREVPALLQEQAPSVLNRNRCIHCHQTKSQMLIEPLTMTQSKITGGPRRTTMKRILYSFALLLTYGGAIAAAGAQHFISSGAQELRPSRVEVVDGKTHLEVPVKDMKKSPSAFAVGSDGQAIMLSYSIKPTATGVEYVFDRQVDNMILKLGGRQAFVQRKQ